MKLDEDQQPVATLKRNFEGGSSAIKMARSKVFQNKSDFDDSNALLFGADESSGGLKIWDVKTAHPVQVVRSVKPVLDIDLVPNPAAEDDSMTICTLTDTNLAIYTRRNPI